MTVPDAAVDACCLINLLAAGPSLLPFPTRRRGKKTSGTATQHPHHLGLTLHVPAKVDQETLYLLQPNPDDAATLIPTEIDLAPYLEAGLVHRCDLQGEPETELFIRLAVSLDDGEAAGLAIAKCRGWLLATDDRKARNLSSQLGVTVITTPQLVRRWANHSRAPAKTIADVLRSIQRFARFAPHHSAPQYRWWMNHLAP